MEKKPSEVYKILDDSQILDDYIIKCYDSLHTLGKDYLIEDITEFAIEKGIQLWLFITELRFYNMNNQIWLIADKDIFL